MTTAEAARRLKVKRWQVARVFEHGDLPDPPRIAGRRVIFADTLPELRKALKKRGFLPSKSKRKESGEDV